jgi:hypothetical protein
MARDIYQNTIAAAGTDGTLRALADIQIYVYLPGTLTVATIYTGRTGPAEAGNPLLTDVTGAVEFYAEVGEYDVRVRDTQAIPRIADRTTSWNAFNGSAQGLPSTLLERDGGIDLAALAEDIKRQMTQIGQVIDWWRPANTVPIPAGFAICDGRTIQAADHDFGTGGPVALPDLRNKFVIGADPFKTDAAASSNGDGSAASGAQHPNAPGIRGVGGSNTTKNLAHSHQYSHYHPVTGVDHLHAFSTPDHLHGPPGIGVSVGMGTANRGTASSPNSGGLESTAYTSHVHGLSANGWAGNTGAADRYLGGYTIGADRSLLTYTGTQNTTTTDNGNITTAADMRPAHVGLLKLMKVKAS